MGPARPQMPLWLQFRQTLCSGRWHHPLYVYRDARPHTIKKNFNIKTYIPSKNIISMKISQAMEGFRVVFEHCPGGNLKKIRTFYDFKIHIAIVNEVILLCIC